MRFTLYIDVDNTGAPNTWEELSDFVESEMERILDYRTGPIEPMKLQKIMSYDGYWPIGGHKVTDK